MALVEKALDYIFGIITENEAFKKFPKDFVTASAQWIRSWFLVDDPKTEAKLADPQRSAESKKTIIEGKLEDLQENPVFVQELEERLATFQEHKSRLKNVVTDASIDAQGNVHIGDKGNSSGDHYDEKNVIKGGTIKAGGDFRLGDDVVTGNEHVQIFHNYYGGGSKGKGTPASPDAGIKSELKALLAKEKTEEVIERLLDLSESSDKDLNNNVLLQSARYTRINNQEMKGVISNAEAGIERNKINDALARLIDALEK
jgi:hypothetical protein